jgi:hypothetical protein
MRLLWGAVLGGLAWRVWLALPVAHWDSSLLSFALGALPYGVLVAFSRSSLDRALLCAVAVAVLFADLALGAVVAHSSSSTASVVLLLAPVGKALALALLLALAMAVSHPGKS